MSYDFFIAFYICRLVFPVRPEIVLPADEVESLAAARKAALSGSEPSDSIRVVHLASKFHIHLVFAKELILNPRGPNLPMYLLQVVNALLTQMDKLKSAPNVIILTTSNITTAIGKLMAYFDPFLSLMTISLI